MVVSFLSQFLRNQAIAMGLASHTGDSAGKHRQRVHIDHSDKTFWKSVVVGLSCAFYWVLAWQSLVVVDNPRLFHGAVFTAVGLCSISADSGLFRDIPRLMKLNQVGRVCVACVLWLCVCVCVFV